MPTVAIPAEIVGDTETIKRRRDAIDGDVLAWADTLVRHSTAAHADPYSLARLTEKVMERRNLRAEYQRRVFVARDLAHADEGNPQHARYVRSGI